MLPSDLKNYRAEEDSFRLISEDHALALIFVLLLVGIVLDRFA